jgi:hypothetical protein
MMEDLVRFDLFRLRCPAYGYLLPAFRATVDGSEFGAVAAAAGMLLFGARYVAN